MRKDKAKAKAERQAVGAQLGAMRRAASHIAESQQRLVGADQHQIVDLGRERSLGPVPPTDHAAARRWRQALEPMDSEAAGLYAQRYGLQAMMLAQMCREAAKRQDLKALAQAQKALSRELYLRHPELFGRD